ncbi:MAG TPA: MOSC domain-containing protein, partial [Polyangiaceae bacterium LLY-WYZ-15_(1-7)]|nr:MOSC domain-containing protein [Polyangiaceae bacterium LLY-WYZ-15_(1-7)]
MRVVRVQVGRAGEIVIDGRAVPTAIVKRPVEGPVAIGRLGLEGDERVLRRRHGEEHHAVYAYPEAHYGWWEERLGRTLAPGIFGENLTVDGPLETEARIGDRIACGTALLQVAQPRIPCRKLRHQLGLRSSLDFLATRRVGYYLRVLREGVVQAGDRFEVVERAEGSPTVDTFVRIATEDYWDVVGLRELIAARDLDPTWREDLGDKLARAEAAEGWLGFRELEVVRREAAGEGAVHLWLACPWGRPLGPHRPGQAVGVLVRPVEGSRPMRRRYAITAREGERIRLTVRVAARRSVEEGVGLVSSYVHALEAGGRLAVSAPRGSWTAEALPRGVRRVTVLSAGMGIAPAVPLVRDLREAGLAVRAVHFRPEPGEPPLWDEARALGFEREGDLDVALRERPPGAVYAAGPRGFVASLGERLEVLGHDGAAFVEEVGPGPVPVPAAPPPPSEPPG